MVARFKRIDLHLDPVHLNLHFTYHLCEYRCKLQLDLIDTECKLRFDLLHSKWICTAPSGPSGRFVFARCSF